MNTDMECAHIWISNSGQGGEPIYRPGPNGPRAPLTVKVRCSLCNARTWFSKDRWEALPKASKPLSSNDGSK